MVNGFGGGHNWKGLDWAKTPKREITRPSIIVDCCESTSYEGIVKEAKLCVEKGGIVSISSKGYSDTHERDRHPIEDILDEESVPYVFSNSPLGSTATYSIDLDKL